MSLKEEIFELTKKKQVYPLPEDTIDDIIKLIKNRIDKVEKDYKNELNNWGKKQPMKDMYPKEMATLERIRKELA